MTDANGAARLGPIKLMPGVLPRHVLTYFFSAFLCIGLFTYVTQLQPYVLGVNLGIPSSQQGAVSGNLAFIAELVIAVSIGIWGSLSDRVGRQRVYIAGFLILGLGYAAYPFADDPAQLALYRVIVGFGVAAVSGMLATILADYPRDESRGVMTGITYFLNGLGVLVFLFVLVKMPGWFQAAGVDELWAGRYSFLAVAGLCVVAALAMLGLKPGPPTAVANREPVLKLLRDGLAEGRKPRIALAYASAFASRGDLAVVGTFLTLWAVQVARAEGLSAAEATAKAGALIGIVQGAALVWAMIFGYIADRIDRVTATLIAMAIATVGYLLLGLEENPLSRGAMLEAALLGIGQMSAILASQVLVAQEAPAATRGSVLGVYGVFGALGILFVSVVGGQLFDSWTPAAPLLIMAGANGLLVIACIAVKLSGSPAATAAVERG